MHPALRPEQFETPDQPMGMQTPNFEDWMVDWVKFRPLWDRGIAALGITETYGPFKHYDETSGLSLLSVNFSGQAEAIVEGRWQPFPPGHVYCVPKGIERGYRSEQAGFRVGWAIFLPRYLRPHALDPVSPSFRTAGDVRTLDPLIMALYNEISTVAEPGVLNSILSAVDRILHRIGVDEPSSGRLSAVWRAVDNRLGHPWTLEEIAHLAGLSAERLRQISQVETQKSPLAYVHFLRMQRSCTLLLDVRKKISTVAFDVGYSNADAFTTAFRKVFGQSPKAFRNEALARLSRGN